MTPLKSFDLPYFNTSPFLLGIDEAGRGSWAGPVSVAGVLLSQDFYQNPLLDPILSQVNDSKQLKPNTRESLFHHIHQFQQQGLLQFKIIFASVQQIESLNILGATAWAMQEIIHHFAHLNPTTLIDGRPLKKISSPHSGIVKGDSKSLAIALASILAKVSRDNLMSHLHSTYPNYHFHSHKGYGTPQHQDALRLFGPSPIHRSLFLRNFNSAQLNLPLQ